MVILSDFPDCVRLHASGLTILLKINDTPLPTNVQNFQRTLIHPTSISIVHYNSWTLKNTLPRTDIIWLFLFPPGYIRIPGYGMVMSPVHQVWPKTILQGIVKGGRRQGRQRIRGKDNIMDKRGVRRIPEDSGEQGLRKNGENWLRNHLWCPNDPRGEEIDEMMRWDLAVYQRYYLSGCGTASSLRVWQVCQKFCL